MDANHVKPPLLAYLKPTYLVSLPERLLRALAAAVGGLVFQISDVALPLWVRRTRLYQALVYRMLRLTVELLGDVKGVFPTEAIPAGDLAVRKAVGNVVELAGFLAFGWSPLWILAAASDLTGGTRAYLDLFVAELRSAGLLQSEVEIQSVRDLLDALESSSAVAADMVDVPPLNVQDLERSWESLKHDASRLPRPEQLAGLYRILQQVSQAEGVSPLEVSGLVAAGAFRAGIQLGSVHIFDYYKSALESINKEGWAVYVLRVARPYASAVSAHFDPRRPSLTEKALRKLVH
jgi:hypothetical protein